MPVVAKMSPRLLLPQTIRDLRVLDQAGGRLAGHLAVLQTLGVSGLASLGNLRIAGTTSKTVVPRPGLLRPRLDVVDASQRRQFRRAYVWNRASGDFEISETLKEAQFLQAESFPLRALALRPVPSPFATRTQSIDGCYWAATRIEIAADTTVLLEFPHHYLTILCEELVVGDNVTFAWELPPEPAGALRKLTPNPRRPTVLRPPTPTLPQKPGEDGAPGIPGIPPTGFVGANGVEAPEIEIWTLNVTGAPKFFLRGQDGWPGAAGCDGGAGADGAAGRNETRNPLGVCDLPARPGGDGGKGGRAGDGVGGGSGGKGGQLRLYAPDAVLLSYAKSGLSVVTEGGSGGPGGSPGVPGPGGDGGAPGATTVCVPYPGYKGGPSTKGKVGAQGDPGAAGPQGTPGEAHPAPIQFLPIDAAMFRQKLIDPAIETVTPAAAGGPPLYEGDRVTIEGLRFAASDRVVVDEVPARTRFIDAEHLSFDVPAVAAGRRELQVLRTNGTRSNPATLSVSARVTAPAAGKRVRPGTMLELTGTGFAPDCRIEVNDSAMPEFQFVDTHTIRCRIGRPARIARKASGEPVDLQVVFPEGSTTDPLRLVLETIRMAVFGDSILWGQGLEEHDKIDSIVEAHFGQVQGGIGVYCENFAHSGAIIGFTGSVLPATPPLSALDGEIPTDSPTILEQVELLSSSPETVDLVLVDGGINDVNFRNILKSDDDRKLKRSIEKYCRDHMLHLLRRVTGRFTAAQVIVTGYYPIISEDSDPDPLNLALLVQAISGGAFDPGVPLPDVLASNCRVFAEHSEKCLQAAVDDINAELGRGDPAAPNRVTLVVPPFGAPNSAFAPDPWVFAVKLDIGLTPQDDLAQHRQGVCSIAPENRTNRWQCERASAGHPNKRGARVYAREVLGALAPPLAPKSFPPDFLWGAATAAYQVEGGITNTDWHIFTTTKAIRDRARTIGSVVNLTVNLEPPDRAVQHGNIPTLIEDLDRARALGMNAYRFSIEWARIEPAGDGRSDAAALQYYDRAIDAMLERGLEPVVTLNHLTLPDWVLTPPAQTNLLQMAEEDAAFKASLRGWENDATVTVFEKFVEKVATRYKDKVDTWITLNEPVGSMIGIGYIGGLWSPGFSLEGRRGKLAYFNLLRAHVRAYDKIKEIYGASPSQVGFAHAMMFCKPSQKGRGLLNENAKARDQFEYFMNWHMLDSLITGNVDTAIEYDQSQRALQPAINFFDLSRQRWHPRLDFLGINYYRSTYVHAYSGLDPVIALGKDVAFTGGKIDPDLAKQPFGENKPFNMLNDLGWEIYPRGIYDIIKDVDDRHDGRLPMLITENGTPERADRNRAAHLVAHVEQLARAVSGGSKVRGYLHWSLIDNFEWQEAYRPEARFGLFTIDRTRTLDRHITEGALAFQAAAKQNGVQGLAERFGRITPHGFGVSAPTQSPGVLFIGTLPNGGDITLFFSRRDSQDAATPAGLMGMMFERREKTWTSLESVALQGTSLSFTRTVAGNRELFTATLSGSRLSGLMGGGRWDAEREPFFGTWRRNEAAADDRDPTHIHLRLLEGSFEPMRGKYLRGGFEAVWREMFVSFPAPKRIRLQMDDGGTFEGLLDRNGKLTGDFKPALTTQVIAASWSRLPDGCGF